MGGRPFSVVLFFFRARPPKVCALSLLTATTFQEGPKRLKVYQPEHTKRHEQCGCRWIGQKDASVLSRVIGSGVMFWIEHDARCTMHDIRANKRPARKDLL